MYYWIEPIDSVHRWCIGRLVFICISNWSRSKVIDSMLLDNGRRLNLVWNYSSGALESNWIMPVTFSRLVGCETYFYFWRASGITAGPHRRDGTKYRGHVKERRGRGDSGKIYGWGNEWTQRKCYCLPFTSRLFDCFIDASKSKGQLYFDQFSNY